jgi:hypothetical protein
VNFFVDRTIGGESLFLKPRELNVSMTYWACLIDPARKYVHRIPTHFRKKTRKWMGHPDSIELPDL